MRILLRHLRIALLTTLTLTVILCGLYPLVVWSIAHIAFADQANGSLVVRNGTVVGSSLIGQSFNGPQYFHPRPSAAGLGYGGASSSGANLGPISHKLLDAVKERVENYRKENGLTYGVLVPADAVTASGSGLDPHISIRNAALQASRVARARGLSEERVQRLVEEHTDRPTCGIFGAPRVNVMMLNLALDNPR